MKYRGPCSGLGNRGERRFPAIERLLPTKLKLWGKKCHPNYWFVTKSHDFFHWSRYNSNNEKIHQCARCSYTTLKKSDLARHVEGYHVYYQVHSHISIILGLIWNSKISIFLEQCSLCSAEIHGRKELQQHLRKDHKVKSTLRVSVYEFLRNYSFTIGISSYISSV